MIRYPLFMILALTLVACAARTDEGYQGEALFSLTGTVEGRVTSVPLDAKLYLAWEGELLNGKPGLSIELPIQSSFPAQFKLDVFEPPDIFPDGPNAPIVSAGFARIVAAVPGTILAETTDWRATPGVLGADPRYYLMYRNSNTIDWDAAIFHASLSPGFYMMQEACISPAHQAEIRECLAKYPAPTPSTGPEERTAIRKDCGLLHADDPWIRLAPDGLATELKVELMDDPSTWQLDPSECI